jgi:hypothetical protein
MKRIVCVIGMSLSLMLIGAAATDFPFNSAFDEYGRICWENEKARLDNFAIALQNADRSTLGHIIVYDGKIACRGEAIARAIRAKKYLVEYRKIEPNRIVWRWGGYTSEMTTQLVLTPRDASIWPFGPSLSIDEVIFIGNCKRKVRPVKCPKW